MRIGKDCRGKEVKEFCNNSRIKGSFDSRTWRSFNFSSYFLLILDFLAASNQGYSNIFCWLFFSENRKSFITSLRVSSRKSFGNERFERVQYKCCVHSHTGGHTRKTRILALSSILPWGNKGKEVEALKEEQVFPSTSLRIYFVLSLNSWSPCFKENSFPHAIFSSKARTKWGPHKRLLMCVMTIS